MTYDGGIVCFTQRAVLVSFLKTWSLVGVWLDAQGEDNCTKCKVLGLPWNCLVEWELLDAHRTELSLCRALGWATSKVYRIMATESRIRLNADPLRTEN